MTAGEENTVNKNLFETTLVLCTYSMPVNMAELTLQRMLGYLTKLACYPREFARS